MSEHNAQRSLVIYKIQIHKRRKPDEICDLDTIRKIGIQALFLDFVNEANNVVRIGKNPPLQSGGRLNPLTWGSRCRSCGI